MGYHTHARGVPHHSTTSVTTNQTQAIISRQPWQATWRVLPLLLLLLLPSLRPLLPSPLPLPLPLLTDRCACTPGVAPRPRSPLREVAAVPAPPRAASRAASRGPPSCCCCLRRPQGHT